ncbi:MAG: YjjG family noncanonical pyrimidine nucleotidase [Flavobacteriales bacterium]
MEINRAIFFDLDRTLWDFEANSEEALREIFFEIEFQRPTPVFEDFLALYRKINQHYWGRYKHNLVTKEELRVGRFLEVLNRFGYSNKEAAHYMADEYVKRSPKKTKLFPGSIEVLSELKKEFNLYVITNGFEEVQHRKIKNCGLETYFQSVITSEVAGAKKPHEQIFRFAEKQAGVSANQCSIIGDAHDADIIGGKQAGWNTIFFDPYLEYHTTPYADYKIYELRQVLPIFGIQKSPNQD